MSDNRVGVDVRRGAGRAGSRRRGFTTLELVVAVAVVGVLAATLLGSFGRARLASHRATCDTQVKSLAIAIDAFRQEKKRYPSHLSDLVRDKYISDPEMLRCPDDPSEEGPGYEAAYVVRSARNDERFPILPTTSQLPTIVCPFHEGSSVGVQAFGGLQTHQFGTRPAVVVSASGASVTRPGEQPVPAYSGMALNGGDLIETSAGAALIRFFDGSSCELGANTHVTVLQSFMQNGDGSLYTLVRQSLGQVAYSVRHGSKFDVSTPTATAGALGTEFTIFVAGQPGSTSYREWWINSSPNTTSQVFCSRPAMATIIDRHIWYNVPANTYSTTTPNGVTPIQTGDEGDGNNGHGNDPDDNDEDNPSNGPGNGRDPGNDG